MGYPARPGASSGGSEPRPSGLPDEPREGAPQPDETGPLDLDEAREDPRRLDERSRRLLDFERQWWRRPGAKEQAIRDAFEISPTRYYQLLNALLDNPAALEHDPVLVQRLRRLRASRRRHRT